MRSSRTLVALGCIVIAVLAAGTYVSLAHTSRASANCASVHSALRQTNRGKLQPGYLELQAVVSPLIPRIMSAVGPRWAGAWFDAADCGRLEVAVRDARNPPQGTSTARAIVSKLGLAAAVRFVGVRYSEAQLVAAQQGIDQRLRSLLQNGKIETYTDWALNAVVVRTARAITMTERDQVMSAIRSSGVRTEVQASKLPLLRANFGDLHHPLSRH